jgi:enamine deaminase RidA (YjgF/YER057c/UK114 family)
MKRTLITPKSMEAFYNNFHFSQATRVGDTIWVSGQTGIDGAMKPGKGMEEQAQLAFQSLKTVLEAAGATLGDVVELVTFHTNLRAEMTAFTKVKDSFFPKNYPAWTAVGVTELAIPGLLVEIRAVAVAGSALS